MNPLTDLKPMHLPPEPGWWPLAPGWWLLVALAFAVLGVVIWTLVQRHRNRRYRREALVALADIERDGASPGQLVALVRRTALSATVTSSWPSAPTETLLERLDQFSGNLISRSFTSYKTESKDIYLKLSNTLYQGSTELTESERKALVEAVERWIRRHRLEDLC